METPQKDTRKPRYNGYVHYLDCGGTLTCIHMSPLNRSKFQCCKEIYCIGTWNVRSMNQDKLNVVKQDGKNEHESLN